MRNQRSEWQTNVRCVHNYEVTKLFSEFVDERGTVLYLIASFHRNRTSVYFVQSIFAPCIYSIHILAQCYAHRLFVQMHTSRACMYACTDWTRRRRRSRVAIKVKRPSTRYCRCTGAIDLLKPIKLLTLSTVTDTRVSDSGAVIKLVGLCFVREDMIPVNIVVVLTFNFWSQNVKQR